MGREGCVAEPGSPGAPRSRPRCLPAGGRCCLAQVSGRRRCVSAIWVSAGARRWAESTGGAGNFASLSFSVEDSLTWAVMRIPSSLFAHPCRGRFPFLYFLFFFSDSGGEERGERVSVRPESKRERQEPQVYGNVETAGELCHQTTLLHLSTCEAWLERLLGAGSDARAPCAPWAGWGGVEPGMEG